MDDSTFFALVQLVSLHLDVTTISGDERYQAILDFRDDESGRNMLHIVLASAVEDHHQQMENISFLTMVKSILALEIENLRYDAPNERPISLLEAVDLSGRRPMDLLTHAVIMIQEGRKYKGRLYDERTEIIWSLVRVLLNHHILFKTFDPQYTYPAIPTFSRRSVASLSLPVLHACCGCEHTPYSLFFQAQKRYKNQLNEPDEYGNEPLHYHCSFPADDDDDKTVLTTLIHYGPSALVHQNKFGDLPFDIARRSGWTMSRGCLQLLKGNPFAVKVDSQPEFLSLLRKFLTFDEDRRTLLYGTLRNHLHLIQGEFDQ